MIAAAGGLHDNSCHAADGIGCGNGVGRDGLAGFVWSGSGFTPRQDAERIPSYELVSIHKTPDAEGSQGIHDEPDGLRAEGSTLRSLISEAYSFSLGELNDRELLGAPGWAKTQRFTVHAKVNSDDVAKLKDLAKAETMMVDVRQMASRTPSFRMLTLQRMLEDRFHLKAHYEQRVMPLYEMTVAKDGLRMKIANPSDPEHGSMEMSAGKLEGANVPISFIPSMFALELERPVADRTGVEENYDLELHWSRVYASDNTGVDAGPSLFTAVEEQMGLKLRPGKGPVWVVVVDHAEMPSEN